MDFDFAFAWSILPDLLPGLLVTLEVVVAGFVLATLLGMLVAVLLQLQSPIISAVCQAYVTFFVIRHCWCSSTFCFCITTQRISITSNGHWRRWHGIILRRLYC